MVPTLFFYQLGLIVLELHPEQTNGGGSAKQWRPWTQAMAAGLTDRVWSRREVLMFRVPSWSQPQAL
jgi:hypothetical protein